MREISENWVMLNLCKNLKWSMIRWHERKRILKFKFLRSNKKMTLQNKNLKNQHLYLNSNLAKRSNSLKTWKSDIKMNVTSNSSLTKSNWRTLKITLTHSWFWTSRLLIDWMKNLKRKIKRFLHYSKNNFQVQ